MQMSDSEPSAQVETCLAQLHRELEKLSVTPIPLRDRYGRGCLEVHDRHGGAIRIHVFPELYWFVWGTDVEERHSTFSPAESARLIVAAMSTADSAGQDLRFTLDPFFR
jgi:hypothetical protein